VAEARTCASLVERIAGRALEDGDPGDPDEGKDPLHPAMLVEDPEAFYDEVAERVTPEHFRHGEGSRGSSASRVVNRCRSLTG